MKQTKTPCPLKGAAFLRSASRSASLNAGAAAGRLLEVPMHDVCENLAHARSRDSLPLFDQACAAERANCDEFFLLLDALELGDRKTDDKPIGVVSIRPRPRSRFF